MKGFARNMLATLPLVASTCGAILSARQVPTSQERESVAKYPWGAPLPDGIAKACLAAPPARFGDSCGLMACENGLSLPQFLAMNEGLLAPDCSNFAGNQKYCTVPKAKPTKLVTPKAFGNTTAPKGIPAPASNFGSKVPCDIWQRTFEGDTCDGYSKSYRISTEQIVQWNPDVGPGCKNLKAGSALCLQPVGYCRGRKSF